MSESGWVRVAEPDACPEGRLLAVDADDLQVVLANVDGTLYALEDVCSHADFPLSEGSIEDGEVECALHGARFDACTGKSTRLPAVRGVRVFEVETRSDGIYVRIT